MTRKAKAKKATHASTRFSVARSPFEIRQAKNAWRHSTSVELLFGGFGYRPIAMQAASLVLRT